MVDTGTPDDVIALPFKRDAADRQVKPELAPDEQAAEGYTHTYRTDGSGYALIYLNGPPPGTQITVTIGGATCTTSD